MDKTSEKETSDIQNYLANFNKEIQCNDLEDVDSVNEDCQDPEYLNNKIFYSYTSGDEVKYTLMFMVSS